MFQVTDKCIGCHNCAMECPVNAIDYVGTKYHIDENTCISCGHCEKVCHISAIIDTENPRRFEAHDDIKLQADVVVCGGGTGLIAAVKAAQGGKKVILLEKARHLGGNTDLAHAFFPIFTKWHEKAGLEDMRENAVEHYLEITDHILAEDVVRTAVYDSGNFFDWLCEVGDCNEAFVLSKLDEVDAYGPIYGNGILFFPNRMYENLKCKDDAIGPGWSGTFIKHKLLDYIEEKNLDVTIMTECAAKHLVLDEDGKISGIVAEDGGGKVMIDTDVVILATGGYAKSKEKMMEFIPEFYDGKTEYQNFTVPTDTGDGIDMLRELGVEPNKDRMFASMFGPKHHPFSNVLADIALEPEMLQINLDGKRWADETLHLHGMSPYISDQPDAISWSIQSLDQIDMIANRFINNPAFANKAEFYKEWKDVLDEESMLDMPVKKADTLEELAELCGMPADALKDTIEEYNAFCANGKDENFGKDASKLLPVSDQGPYYAIYGQRFCDQAGGGLMVDGKCRVLRNNGSYIPGLYGVGDATSAMHRKGKLAVISEMTWAVASSFRSGSEAVTYQK